MAKYKNFEEHKKSDTVKWVIAFFLIILLLGAVSGLSVGMWKLIKPAKPVVETENVTWNFVALTPFDDSDDVRAFFAPKEFSLENCVGKPLSVKLDGHKVDLVYAKVDEGDGFYVWTSDSTFENVDFGCYTFTKDMVDEDMADMVGRVVMMVCTADIADFEIGGEHWVFSFKEDTIANDDARYFFAPKEFDLKTMSGKKLTVDVGEKNVSLSYFNEFKLGTGDNVSTDYWVNDSEKCGFVVMAKGMDDFAQSIGLGADFEGRLYVIVPADTVVTVIQEVVSEVKA